MVDPHHATSFDLRPNRGALEDLRRKKKCRIRGRESMRSICFFSLRRAAVAMLAALGCVAALPACAQYPDEANPRLPSIRARRNWRYHVSFGHEQNHPAHRHAVRDRQSPGRRRHSVGDGREAATPDGYSLLQVGNSYALSTSLFKSLPYDLVKDFAPISTLAQFDVLLAVKSSGEIGTIQRLVEIDRANPGKLNFGTISAGSTQNLSAEMFKALIGSKASVVPYKTLARTGHRASARGYRCLV